MSDAVSVPLGTDSLDGELTIPDNACGLVLFAHGSGSSRHSLRNKKVAADLNRQDLATFLIDLLTAAEESDEPNSSRLSFNIELLARRLGAATQWLLANERTGDLPVGYFGASTGAAAALVASIHQPVGAIVSRGGRPDLAADSLEHVAAPTLLLVGARDFGVIELNEQAYTRLQCPKDIRQIPGAAHLFEEPGTLDKVSDAAAAWFLEHLCRESDLVA